MAILFDVGPEYKSLDPVATKPKIAATIDVIP
jgi:hypothetical protein